MRNSWKPAAAGLLAGVLIGCAAQEAPDTPMATSGPNQVVIKVPGMT